MLLLTISRVKRNGFKFLAKLKRTDIIYIILQVYFDYIIFQLRRPDRRAIIGLFVQPEEF